MSLKTWWAEKKFQIGLGMRMQLEKYPDTDPRKKKLQETADKLQGALKDDNDKSEGPES